MQGLFYGAAAFNQDIGSWNIGNLSNATNMLQGVALSVENYNALLIGWAGQNVTFSVNFNRGNSQYSPGAPETARDKLINSDNWSITDDGITATPSSPSNVQANAGSQKAILTWDPAEQGGAEIANYQVLYSTSENGTYTPAPNCENVSTDAPLTCTVTVLTNGTEYFFKEVGQITGGASGLASSPAVAVTPNAIAPVNTEAPMVSGTTTTGQTLSVTERTWTGEPAPGFSYQWQACDDDNCDGVGVEDIGEDSNEFTLTTNQIGKFIRVIVTGSNVAGNTDAASNVIGPVENSQQAQNITFTLPKELSIDSKPIKLNGIATSGLPVSYSTTTPTICDVSGSTLTLKKVGNCAVTATQNGSDAWLPAEPVTRSTAISPLPNVLLPECGLSSCAGADLSDMDLHGQNLSGVNFDRANLRNANLTHANLTGARFFRANLARADARKANFA